MAVKTEKTADQVRFIEGPEAGYDKTTFAKDTYLCTDTGRLYMRGREVTDPATAASLKAHIASKNNPHAVTKAQVGLDKVDNTADKDKIVYTGNLHWGGANWAQSVDPVSGAAFPFTYTNRSAFAKPEGWTAEYSRDGGETWTEYPLSETNKRLFFSTFDGNGLMLGGPDAYVAPTINDQLRITMSFVEMGLYFVLVHMMVYENGTWPLHGMDIDVATFAKPSEYKRIATDVHLGGWPKWNSVNINGNGQTVGMWNNNSTSESAVKTMRLTFRKTSTWSSAASNVGSVGGIALMGWENWCTASTMGARGTLYSYDHLQNAMFPAKLYTHGYTEVIDTAGAGLTKSGSTLAVDGNKVMNNLPVDTSDAQMDDYYICQYAGGGTTTTTYHRRKVRSLYNCLKSEFTTGANAVALLNKLGVAADVPSDETYVVLSGASAGDSSYYRRKLPLLAQYVAGKIPAASTSRPGLMSAADKQALGAAATAASVTELRGSVTAITPGKIALDAGSSLPKDASAAYMAATAAAQNGTPLLMTTASDTGLYATIAATSVMSASGMVMIDAMMNGKARRLTLTNTGSEVTVSGWTDL